MDGRTVTVVLVDQGGVLLGALAPYQVDSPWWQEVAEVVDGAYAHHKARVAVLRVLGADRPVPPGGHVRYLAVVDGPPAAQLVPVDVDLAPHPSRAPWAEPGGPGTSIAWAAASLAALGRPARGVAQQRTWNLSAIWRIDTDAGPVWLKQVPSFFAHEPAVLRWLGAVSGPVPVLLAEDGAGRMLLDHVPGADRYGAGTAERLTMLAQLHTIQVLAAGEIESLISLGVPDLRGPRLAELVRDVVRRHGTSYHLDDFMNDLDRRMAGLQACGLPDTLVHGDFHPGNVRAGESGERHTIIDWGDSLIGHPAIDILRMCEQSDDPAQLRDRWCRMWRAAVPGCDPDRAVALLEPVAAVRNAAVYAAFLAAIEPSEWPYHREDVPDWLRRAALCLT